MNDESTSERHQRDEPQPTLLEILLLTIFTFVSTIYDIVTFVPYTFYYLFFPSDEQPFMSKSMDDRAGPYRNIKSIDELTTTPAAPASTVAEMWQQSVKRYPQLRCLGTREILKIYQEEQNDNKKFTKYKMGKYKWLTYEQVHRRVLNFSRGIKHPKLSVEDKDKIIFFMESREEWMIGSQACFQTSIIISSLYATLGEEGIVHGINDSNSSVIVTSEELLPKLLKVIDKCPKIKKIIYAESQLSKRLMNYEKLEEENIEILAMKYVEELGRTSPQIELHPPTPDDIAVLMYTSGSTNKPKGVLMTHRNIMASNSGQLNGIFPLRPSDIYIGYLPLAHILELDCENTVLSQGCSIGYSSAQTIMDTSTGIPSGEMGDIRVLRPTIMTVVPLILNRIYKTIWGKVDQSNVFRRSLFRFAYRRKSKFWIQFDKNPFLDRFIFRKFLTIMGGNIRGMLCGGAPLPPEIQQFVSVCFCCPVLQGYGLTETSGAGTVTPYNDRITGRVGAPMTSAPIKLVDWMEGNYRSINEPYPQGEIYIGGPGVAVGYYNLPEDSLEHQNYVVDEDGERWFASGDIGEIHSDGAIKIIDRKKDLIKLSAGEYISLARVEGVLKLHPLIENVMAYGDSAKTYLIALCLPSINVLKEYAEKAGLKFDENGDCKTICTNTKITEEILKTLKEFCSKNGLQKFEIPQRIALLCDTWTPDTGLVTEAFKLKRTAIRRHYDNTIDRLYALTGARKITPPNEIEKDK
ncbi:hypothetical protein SNEBB_007325 [Seison nebaliae]|nr:hypothetical protein SNEBB_007325 [Seison nebaliae]